MNSPPSRIPIPLPARLPPSNSSGRSRIRGKSLPGLPGFASAPPAFPALLPPPIPALPVQLPASSFCSWYYAYRRIHYMYSNKIYSHESRPNCRKKARKNWKKNLDRIYQSQTLISWKTTWFREKQQERRPRCSGMRCDASREDRVLTREKRLPGPTSASPPGSPTPGTSLVELCRYM